MNGMILIEMLSGLVVAIGGMTGIFAWSRRRMRRSGELAVVKALCDGKTERHEVWQAAWWTLGGPRHKDTLLAARSVDAGLQSLVDAGKLLVVQSEAVKETLACERPDEHRIEYRLSQPGQSSDGLLPASSSRIPAPVSADGVVMALTGLLAWSLLALMLMSWILQW